VVGTRPDIAEAVDVLRRGGLVAFPTETVYGLGCDAESRAALRRLYEVKGRPHDHPVIVHLGDAALLDQWAAHVSPAARALADAYWPGPLTLVVSRDTRVPDEVTGGRSTVGLRVPDQPVALSLLRAFGSGIAAPSANRFGATSPTRADDVRADLGDDIDLLLDDGPCTIGIESTIVDCSVEAPAILRLGGVSREHVESIVGGPVAVRDRGEVAAPGTLPAHYAPRCHVQLTDASELAGRAVASAATGSRVGVLTPASVASDLPPGVVRLASPADADEYARVLYARLREADRRGVDVLLVVPPAHSGIGEAVLDRLQRAAGAPA
jgi:L-threonylcarbamoyladenylate synthase